MSLKPLAFAPLKREWLKTKPTYVDRVLDVPVPPRGDDPVASFKALVDTITGIDTRSITLKSTNALAEEFAVRAHLLLDARGVEHYIETTNIGARLCLKADASDTSKLGRFVSSWGRRGASITYAPAYLLRYGVAGHANMPNLRIGLGHHTIADADPSLGSVPHEALHIDTQLRERAGEASPYHGSLKADPANKSVLPGGIGHYGGYAGFDELRAHSRDLRQRVRTLSRVDLRHSADVEKARGEMRLKSKSLLRNSMMMLATLKQTRSRLKRAAVVSKRTTHGLNVTITVKTRRDPTGYVVRLPLFGVHKRKDPSIKDRIAEELDWRIETARGHLAMARIALQADASLDAPEAIPAMCAALKDVLAQRQFVKSPGIRAATYDALLARYNQHTR
jgi:hypothetical protein